MAMSMEGSGTTVRVTPSRRRADEWAVVLAAEDIPHWLRRRLDGWALLVPPPAAIAALEALEAYDRENSSEPVAGGGEGAPSRRGVCVRRPYGLYAADRGVRR